MTQIALQRRSLGVTYDESNSDSDAVSDSASLSAEFHKVTSDTVSETDSIGREASWNMVITDTPSVGDNAFENDNIELAWGGILTSVTTASANTRYGFNASGGTFTISAPGTPSNGVQFSIVETSEDETGVTVSGNGNNIWDPISEEYVSSFLWIRGELNYVYDGTNWSLI